MPAVTFNVRWPNGQEEQCYSPSTVILDYFTAGESVSAEEFLKRSEVALTKASERVAQKFGFACSSAADQLQEIRDQVAKIEDPKAKVTVLSLKPIARS